MSLSISSPTPLHLPAVQHVRVAGGILAAIAVLVAGSAVSFSQGGSPAPRGDRLAIACTNAPASCSDGRGFRTVEIRGAATSVLVGVGQSN